MSLHCPWGDLCVEVPMADAEMAKRQGESATRSANGGGHTNVAQAVRRWSRPNEERSDSLTPREWEVLQLLSKGLQARHVAEQLGLGVRTIQMHISHINGKLGTHSYHASVLVARQCGMLGSQSGWVRDPASDVSVN